MPSGTITKQVVCVYKSLLERWMKVKYSVFYLFVLNMLFYFSVIIIKNIWEATLTFTFFPFLFIIFINLICRNNIVYTVNIGIYVCGTI